MVEELSVKSSLDAGAETKGFLASIISSFSKCYRLLSLHHRIQFDIYVAVNSST